MARRVWAPTFVPHRLDGAVLDCLLPALIGIASLDLLERPLPPLYELAGLTGGPARVRYIPDPLGVREDWLAPRRVLERGGGDCKSLVAWRVAELRIAGELDADARHVEQTIDGDGLLFHVFVVRADGTFEDPSTLLGMRFPTDWVWLRAAG